MTQPTPPAGPGSKVPLVSEVVDRLMRSHGGQTSRRPALFQAALQVCGEELRRVKKGAQPANIDELVARAEQMILAPPGRPSQEVPIADADLTPLIDRTLTAASAVRAAQQGLPISPPQQPDLLDDTSPPSTSDPFAAETIGPPLDSEEASTFDPFPGSPAAPSQSSYDSFLAPADSMLPPRNEIENSLPPYDSDQPPGEFGNLFENAALEEVLLDRRKDRRRRAPILWFFLFAIVVLTTVAGYIYLQPRLFGPGGRFANNNGMLPTPTPRYPAMFDGGESKPTPTSSAFGELTTPTPTPLATTSGVALVEPVETTIQMPAAEPTSTPSPTPTEPPINPTPIPSSRRGQQGETPAYDGGVPVMVSPDWTGRPAVYAIHFSSFREKEKAIRDAARLAAVIGLRANVAQVDLGRETWYRVMLGEFATSSEALSYRATLVARKTEGLSSVYKLIGIH